VTDPPTNLAVLDASVLVPAAPRDTLLRLAFSGVFEARWSDLILEEVRRTLVNDRFTDAGRATRLIATMTSRFPDARVDNFDHLIEEMTNHPGDRHVLAVAVATGASVIVTDNLRHFRVNDLAPHAIEAQSVDQFLNDRLDDRREKVIELLHLQASMLHRPPMSVQDVLERLRIHAPVFVERISDSIEPESRSEPYR
jgi:predicted nucleic acid-binding protein